MPTRSLALLAAFVLAIFGTACRRDTPEETGTIMRDAGMSGPTDSKHGSQGKIIVNGQDGAPRTYLNCPKPQRIEKGDRSTPEGTLYLAFQAILSKDEEAGFRDFLALVNPQMQREDDVRRYWWKSARGTPFLRLVYGQNNPTFDICERRPEGPDKVRIFVAKSPPVGSNPPYLLHKVNDTWLLDTFTPH